MCVIEGTSGSGKSTFLNCIGGLDILDSGSIMVDGMEIVGMKADTIILGTKKLAESNYLEDGEFSLFVPLSDKETEELTDKGITLEEQFYLDYAMADVCDCVCCSISVVFCN